MGGVVVRHKVLPVVAVVSKGPNQKFVFALWRGKAAKPMAYFSFLRKESMEKSLSKFWEQAEESLAYKDFVKKEKKAKRLGIKASDHWTVGDVIYNSWGYDQTNVDWYQVVEIKPRSIVICRICGATTPTQYLSGTTLPCRHEFSGEPMLKTLDANGQITFAHGAGTKWNGKAVWHSWTC